jgi:hypothetical protein
VNPTGRVSEQQQAPSIMAVPSLSALFATTTTSILHVLDTILSPFIRIVAVVLSLAA